MVIEEKEEIKESKYNSAIQQLIRINRLWNMGHSSSLKGDLERYKFVLDRVWCELSPDSTKAQSGEREIKVKEIIETMKKIKKHEEIMKNKELLYEQLQNYEILLRRIQNKQGKGTSYIDEFDEAIE